MTNEHTRMHARTHACTHTHTHTHTRKRTHPFFTCCKINATPSDMTERIFSKWHIFLTRPCLETSLLTTFHMDPLPLFFSLKYGVE